MTSMGGAGSTRSVWWNQVSQTHLKAVVHTGCGMWGVWCRVRVGDGGGVGWGEGCRLWGGVQGVGCRVLGVVCEAQGVGCGT